MRKRLPKKKTSLRIVRKLPVDVSPAGYERLAKGMFDHKTTSSYHDFAHRSPLAFASFMNDDNFEVPSVFRLPKGTVHAANWSFAC